MSMRKGTLKEIQKVAVDVLGLIDTAITEIDVQETYAERISGGSYHKVLKYPKGTAPDNERHPMYSMTTAALKRRSMDLTRLLAELRRSN